MNYLRLRRNELLGLAQKREVLFAFFVNCIFVGIAGWAMETLLGIAEYGVIRDRGYLLLPICPIYSVGLCAILVLVRIPKRNKRNVIHMWIAIAVGATVFEGICGYLIEFVFGIELWNYLDWPISMRYVSLLATIAWATLGTVYLYCVVPWIKRMALRIPKVWWRGICVMVLVMLLMDFSITTYKAIHHGGHQPYYRIKVFERGFTGNHQNA